MLTPAKKMPIIASGKTVMASRASSCKYETKPGEIQEKPHRNCITIVGNS
jgi:hypothetical protein